MALYYRSFSTWTGLPGIYLEDLYVRPAYRGLGMGKRCSRRWLVSLSTKAALGWSGPSSTGTSRRSRSTGRSAPSPPTSGPDTALPGRRSRTRLSVTTRALARHISPGAPARPRAARREAPGTAATAQGPERCTSDPRACPWWHRRTGVLAKVLPVTIETAPSGVPEQVTILGYGAMELRGQPWGPAIADEEAGQLLNAVLDEGINLIDTSIDYGRSEELIGQHLVSRRDEYFLASKCGCPLERSTARRNAAVPPRLQRGQHPAGLEQSLRRLRTDRLDLLQVHMSPSRTQMEADGDHRDARGASGRGQDPVSSECPGRFPTCPTISPWASSTSSRSPIRRSSASTRT